MSYQLEPIGRIHTNRIDHDHTPVQTTLNWGEPGEIHLDHAYIPALEGLDEFTHLWILTWLHQPDQPTGASIRMQQTPFLLQPTGATKGVFAIRGPRRPNPIGLHLVRIANITLTPPVIAFHGVDMIDDTPVLDLKPWVSRFDQPPEANPRSGWYDDLDIQQTTPSDLATEQEQQP